MSDINEPQTSGPQLILLREIIGGEEFRIPAIEMPNVNQPIHANQPLFDRPPPPQFLIDNPSGNNTIYPYSTIHANQPLFDRPPPPQFLIDNPSAANITYPHRPYNQPWPYNQHWPYNRPSNWPHNHPWPPRYPPYWNWSHRPYYPYPYRYDSLGNIFVYPRDAPQGSDSVPVNNPPMSPSNSAEKTLQGYWNTNMNAKSGKISNFSNVTFPTDAGAARLFELVKNANGEYTGAIKYLNSGNYFIQAWTYSYNTPTAPRIWIHINPSNKNPPRNIANGNGAVSTTHKLAAGDVIHFKIQNMDATPANFYGWFETWLA